jgi:hypothetical protein
MDQDFLTVKEVSGEQLKAAVVCCGVSYDIVTDVGWRVAVLLLFNSTVQMPGAVYLKA